MDFSKLKLLVEYYKETSANAVDWLNITASSFSDWKYRWRHKRTSKKIAQKQLAVPHSSLPMSPTVCPLMPLAMALGFSKDTLKKDCELMQTRANLGTLATLKPHLCVGLQQIS